MSARYLIGDVLEVLPTLEESSVDLILTSPPFLALRSYLPADHPDKAKEGGSQSTPGEFIDWLIDVTEALDRVLAPHGSMCIELGDTYAGSGGGGGDYLENGWREGQQQFAGSAASMRESNAAHWRQKNQNPKAWPADKSLSLIPELFRFTLVYGFNPLTQRQTKPWRLRNVVRWVRPNPPVGALGDKFRPATSELMVFCRTDEAGRRRYFDLDAVREPFAEATIQRTKPGSALQSIGGAWDNSRPPALIAARMTQPGAPPFDWWEIPPGGYSGAHYAVFPEALCVKPIKAMSPEKVCRTCGEPSRRITRTDGYVHDNGQQRVGDRLEQWTTVEAATWGANSAKGVKESGHVSANVVTLGFTDCGHDNYRPGLVLDPFAGSGTTLAVAVGHGRDAIGIDLDERNARLAGERIGFFLEVVA